MGRGRRLVFVIVVLDFLNEGGVALVLLLGWFESRDELVDPSDEESPKNKELRMMSSKRMEMRVDMQITKQEVQHRRNWSGLREEISWERWCRE
ncbi:U-box domain-containing protein 16 [Pyrus ussuriensis x Pyrus communis]|uniref:U-box domain-containing protein 16 n=1 Tax=Pyrus ussuriensis x Pyrus communis TaxID=2448454 RepID=A0A5N5FTI6_9ROSA|nr:U-box domain-containing protein 16 [Pyrus ussuriensis x Pyrus communis]